MFFFIDNFRQAPPYFYTGVPSHGSWRPVKAIAYLCSFCTDISQTVSNVPYHYTAFLLYFLYVFTPENFIILGIHNLFPLRIGWEPAAEFLNSRVRQPSWENRCHCFFPVHSASSQGHNAPSDQNEGHGKERNGASHPGRIFRIILTGYVVFHYAPRRTENEASILCYLLTY